MVGEQETAPTVSTVTDSQPPKGIKELNQLVVTIGLMVILTIVVTTLCVGLLTNASHQQTPQIITVTPVPTQVPVVTATPTPTPTTTPALPATLTFTVLQASMAQYNSPTPLEREYRVYTTDGMILVLSDYYQWNVLYPNYVYTCAVTGRREGYGAIYTVNSCTAFPYQKPIALLQPYNYYPEYVPYKNDNSYYDVNDYTYYHNNNRYFRCDRYGNTCTEINIGRIPAYVSIRESYPPHYLDTNPKPKPNR